MKLLKKDNGSSYISMFALVITVITVAAASMIFSSYMVNIDRKTEVDSIARKYLLIMETQGCLYDTDEQALREELAENHMKTDASSFNGTTTTPAGYGNEITLRIRGKLQLHNIKMLDLFKIDYDGREMDIEITKKSISKQ